MHESCGHCGPCREGTACLSDIMDKFAAGKATKKDLADLEAIAAETTNCICALAGASSDPIKGLLKHFKKDLAKRCILGNIALLEGLNNLYTIGKHSNKKNTTP